MSNGIEVARNQDTIYTRIVGLGSFNNAGPFRAYVEAMLQDGARRVIVDMAACTGVDSTFMGTLMGFLTCPLAPEGHTQKLSDAQVRVLVVNQTPPTRRAMESLGIHRILDVREDPVPAPSIPMQRLRDDWADAKARVKLIKEAHEHLIELDPGNYAKFKPFLDMLTRDMEGGTGA